MVTLDQVRTQISDRAQIWPAQSDPPELIGIGDGVATIFGLRFENSIPGSLTVYTAPATTAGSGAAPVWTAVSTTPSVIVGTTSETAVAAAGGATITPVSMANIAEGVSLLIDQAPNQEVVTVASVTGTTFTANFALAHAVGFVVAGAPPYSVGSPNAGTNGTTATNAVITFAQAPAAGVQIGARCQLTAFSDTDLEAYLARAQALYDDDVSVLKRTQYDILDVLAMDYDRLIILAQGDYRKDPSIYRDSLQQLKAELRQDLFGGPVAGTAIPQLFIGASVQRRYVPLR